MKLLVVEDSPIVRAAYVGFLSKYFRHIDAATDGLEALVMAKNRYDVILMDIYLPHVNGIDITAQVRRQKTNSNSVIIGITSDTNPERHQMCLDAGMNALLQKPVTLEKILKTIKRFIALRKVKSPSDGVQN